MSWMHTTDYSRLVMMMDGEAYTHEKGDTEGQPGVKIEDQICETCDCSDPKDPHGYGPEDEKIGKGFSYWYDIERTNFVNKHKGQGTTWYCSGGLMICSICIAGMLDRIDSGDLSDVTYHWSES